MPDSNPEPVEEMNGHDERGTRSFFALLSFLLAVIMLSIFINNTLDGLSRMLVLFVMLAFGMIGFLLLDPQSRLFGLRKHTPPTDPSIPNDETPAEELTPFEQLVREALDAIPPEFQERMENLVVIVEPEPAPSELEHTHGEEGAILLGLYHGVPLTVQSYQQPLLPERITIYQHNIERICDYDPDRIREQVLQTVLHEVAHHFGMGHDEMPIWIK